MLYMPYQAPDVNIIQDPIFDNNYWHEQVANAQQNWYNAVIRLYGEYNIYMDNANNAPREEAPPAQQGFNYPWVRYDAGWPVEAYKNMEEAEKKEQERRKKEEMKKSKAEWNLLPNPIFK